jgi:hypothetical protein
MVERGLTVTNCINGVKIRDVEKSIGVRSLIKAISFVIINGCESFNIKGNINKHQAFVLSSDLVEMYRTESVEDIIMMFKYARLGKLNDKPIWRVDSQVILGEWFPAYLELKAEELEKVNRQKSIQVESKDIDNDRAQYLKYIIEQGRGNKPKKDYGEVKKKIDPALAHSKWLERLPKICEILNLSELIQNQIECEKKGFNDAVEIYEIEINKRK